MSTLRISNIEAKSVPASATIDEKVKITNSSGDPLVFIDGKTSGITTVGINTTDPNITFDANSNVVVTGIITATKFSGEFEPTSVGIADSIFHTGDTDTVIRFPADNQIQFKTNGTERMIIGSSGNITLNNELRIPNAIAHVGDNDTQIKFPADDTITLETAGSQRVRVDASGVVIVATGAARTYVDGAGNTQTPLLQIEDNSNSNTAIVLRYNSGAGSANRRASFMFARTADGSAVSNNSVLGEVLFMGEGNNTLEKAASIRAEVDGTPGTTDMPGRLIFSTTADGANTTTERVRIGAAGSMTHYCGDTNSQGFFVMGHASQGRTTLAVRAGNTNSNANSSFRLQHATGTTVGSLFLNHDDNNYNMMNAIVGGQIVFHTNESGSSLPKMRIHPDGDVQITSGNLVVASGNGIDFSATSDSGNGTMSNELFDDYEEGSWTPSFNTSNSSGTLQNITYNIQEGRYIKIGSTVYVEGALRTTFVTVAGSAGTYDIAGLPFTNNSGGTYGVSGIIHCEAQFNWDNAPHHFSVMNNATYMRGRGGIRVGDASYTNGLTTDFNDGSGAKNRVYFSGVYSTDF